MTAQSKVNIKAAVEAVLIPVEDGYTVQLRGESGGTYTVSNANGPIAYGAMATAKTAVRKHNSSLPVDLKPTI
jgi:hypothetical protein